MADVKKKIEEPKLISEGQNTYWEVELAKLLRALTILVVVGINKLKEEK